MRWLDTILVGDSLAGLVVAIAVAAAAGVALGHRKYRGLSLGIAGVMFTGILYGHCFWRPDTVAAYARLQLAQPVAAAPMTPAAQPGAVSAEMPAAPDEAAVRAKVDAIRHARHEVLEFVRDFGLILFVFAVGMSVGPGFLSSLRREGVKWNILAATNVLLAVGMAWLAYRLLHLSLPEAVGALSGAVTNTPGLSAAQQAIRDALRDPEAVSLAATAFAVAYPCGMFGKMSIIVLFRSLFRIDFQREAERFRTASGGGAAPVNIDLEVRNPAMDGRAIHDVLALIGDKAVISRLRRDGQVRIANHHETLRLGDAVHAVGDSGSLDHLEQLLGGRSTMDLRAVDGPLVVRKIIVTDQRAIGVEVARLELPKAFGVTITRVNRAGIEFVAVDHLKLNFADTLTIVGPEEGVARVTALLGNAPKRLEHPQLVPMFLAILLGVLLGSLPIPSGFPAPVKLGLAGGPIIVALALSAMGRFGRLSFFMPASANLLLKEFGIVLFLVAVGLLAGEEFFAKAFSLQGATWAAAALAIVMVPLAITVLLARFVARMDYLAIMGLVSGSTTDPPTMSFACSLAGSEAPAVTFATVYPLTMLLRIITAQVFVLLLVR